MSSKKLVVSMASLCLLGGVGFHESVKVHATEVNKVKSSAYANIDAGQGKVWGDQAFSPYIDSGLWYNGENNYQGLYPLAQESAKSNIKYANIGFIVSDPSSPKTASFGGYYNVDGTGTNGDVTSAFATQIKNFREKGGDVMVSFGGENGTPLHKTITNVDELADKYIEIINHYGLTNIDFDIEGSQVLDKEAWQRNNQALKIVQEKMGENTPKIWFTFPVLPTGLVGEGTGNDAYNVLDDAVKSGVNVNGVNIMTMCFGPSFVTGPTTEYYKYVIQAAESLNKQIKTIYKAAGQELTDKEVYAKIGVTPWIGKSSQENETFVQSDAEKILAYGKEKGLGMLSFWSLNRDNNVKEDLKNPGIEEKGEYEFSHILNGFNGGDNQNNKPTISGANDKNIQIGEKFDPKSGVKATDIEDGDLTDKIMITGSVDTTKVGKYTLTYTVSDSAKNKTVKKRVITVKEKTNEKPVFSGTEDTTVAMNTKFDAMKGVKALDTEDGDITSSVKVTGTVDTSKIGKNTLTYTVTDSDKNTVTTKRVVTVVKREVAEWSADKVYQEGDHVMYDGKEYKANYWTQGNKPSESVNIQWTCLSDDKDTKDWNAGSVYVTGDRVLYNGKEYEANYWTQGDVPSKSEAYGPWKLVG